MRDYNISDITTENVKVIKPILSVIIPCYNSAEFLRETLDCLNNQTLDDWECVIVNDGSTDNSLDIINEYIQKDSRYKLIDKVNEGPAVARNTAIAVALGKYILPLDADDLIGPAYAETAIRHLEMHPETKLVYCDAELFGDQTGRWVLPDYSYEQLLWANPIFCSAVFRRSDYDKTPGYNPNMRHGIEDWAFWLSLLNENDEVYKIPETMFWYRKHGDSLTTECSANIDMALGQMVSNHLDKYIPYFGQMFRANSEVLYLKGEIQKLLNSRKYKLGKAILQPLNFILNHKTE